MTPSRATRSSSTGQTTLIEDDAFGPSLDRGSFPGDRANGKACPVTAVAIETVFVGWQAATGRTNTVLDPKRRSKIKAALALYPLDDVLDAVRGWQNDAFYCGENDRRKTYNDLSLLLRDAEHIERFRDMARGPVVKRGGQKAARTGNGDLWSRLARGTQA